MTLSYHQVLDIQQEGELQKIVQKFGNYQKMSGTGSEVCLKCTKSCFQYDKNELEAGSPDSPLIKNERGELVRAPKIESFDYPDISEINTKQLVDYLNRVFKKNKRIPKNVKASDEKEKQEAFRNKNQWRPWP